MFTVRKHDTLIWDAIGRNNVKFYLIIHDNWVGQSPPEAGKREDPRLQSQVPELMFQ